MQDLVFEAVLDGRVVVNARTQAKAVSEEVQSGIEKARQHRMTTQLQQLRLREAGMIRREYENLQKRV